MDVEHGGSGRPGPGIAGTVPDPMGGRHPPTRAATAARAVADRVRHQQPSVLAQLYRGLFSVTDRLRPDPVRPTRPPVTGSSVGDRSVLVRVAADVIDLATAVERGLLPSPVEVGVLVLLVSVAGHHRTAPGPVALSPAEAEGWARAVFGTAWENGAYQAGDLRPAAAARAAARFYLFLGPEQTPVAPPAGWTSPLWPLTRP